MSSAEFNQPARKRTNGTAARQPASRLAAALLLGWMVLLSPTAATRAADETWIYSPYQIQVWLAADESPRFHPRRLQQIAAALPKLSYVYAGSTWKLHVGAPPDRIRHLALRDLNTLTVERIEATAADVLGADKLIIVSLQDLTGGFQIAARELDCRSRIWGPTVNANTPQVDRLDRSIFAAISKAFAPLARIETVSGKDSTIELRAGGLIVSRNSPSLIDVGQVMQPVVRQNDRNGNPLQNGIQIVEWTLLHVKQRQGASLRCEVVSGFRTALRGTTSSRTQRFALGLRPISDVTYLQLRSRGTESEPLQGYDAYSKSPVTDAKAEADPEPARKIGRSDWRGVVEVRANEHPMQIVYVKNGNQNLARLPLVPGVQEQMVATMPNDDQRLHAEAAVLEMQTRIMNLVMQRQIMAQRIRARIKSGEIDGDNGAKQLLIEMGELETRKGLERRLNETQEQILTKLARPDSRIDALFKNTRTLLGKFLDPNLADELTREVQAAQTGG